jgi:hypothetical protein
MKDVIAAVKEAFGLRPKQAVGVRNQSDTEHRAPRHRHEIM